MIDKAVIVAAGQSSRLRPLTTDVPKGLLNIGSETILGRSVRLLKETGVSEIAIVVGFRHETIRRHFSREKIEFLLNPFYSVTNNLASLWFAQKWIGNEAFLYLHGDVVYDGTLLSDVFNAEPAEALLVVEDGRVDEEAMKVRLDNSGSLIESNKSIPLHEANGEWIGIATFSSVLVPRLFAKTEEIFAEGLHNAYDTEAFTRLAGQGHPIRTLPVNGKHWVEVDFLEDLNLANELFTSKATLGK